METFTCSVLDLGDLIILGTRALPRLKEANELLTRHDTLLLLDHIRQRAIIGLHLLQPHWGYHPVTSSTIPFLNRSCHSAHRTFLLTSLLPHYYSNVYLFICYVDQTHNINRGYGLVV